MPDLPEDAPRTASFELVDRSGYLVAVRLAQEIGLPGPLRFTRRRGVWRLDVEVSAVARMEYLFDLTDHNGAHATITDPANPRRVPGAFGEKSVLEFPGYHAPRWLDHEGVPAEAVVTEFDAPGLDASVEVMTWSPASLDAGEPAPLLVVHDGPEYDRLGGLSRYLAAGIESGAIPPMRAALLGPGDRNAWYSANAEYTRTLTETVLPGLDDALPTTVRIGVGASLGALAMLHAHRSAQAFDGLFLQSGSFFTPELDPQEKDFPGFEAVTEFVADVHGTKADPRPVPTVITCGTVEENLANNVAMADTLRRLGYPAALVQVPDAHNYTAWRDALDPHLTELIAMLVRARAA